MPTSNRRTIKSTLLNVVAPITVGAVAGLAILTSVVIVARSESRRAMTDVLDDFVVKVNLPDGYELTKIEDPTE